MLTKEQRAQAELKMLEKILDDAKRNDAKRNSEQARKGMSMYGLPYRVYLDYLKVGHGTRQRNGEIPISEIYPLQGYPISDVRVVMFPTDFDNNQYEAYANTCPMDDRGRHKVDLLPMQPQFIKADIKTELEELHTALVDKYKQWDVYGDKWEYYFLRFLDGYDFNTFGEFEFYGTVGKYNDADINKLRKQYTALQGKYKANKDMYLGVPLVDADAKEQYCDLHYRIVWEDTKHGIK